MKNTSEEVPFELQACSFIKKWIPSQVFFKDFDWMIKNTSLPGQLSMIASIEMEDWRVMCPCIVFPINFYSENTANGFRVTVYLWSKHTYFIQCFIFWYNKFAALISTILHPIIYSNVKWIVTEILLKPDYT